MITVVKTGSMGKVFLLYLVFVVSIFGCFKMPTMPPIPTPKTMDKEINIIKEIKFGDGYEKTEKACNEVGLKRMAGESTTQLSNDTSVTVRTCFAIPEVGFSTGGEMYLSLYNEKGLLKKVKVRCTVTAHSVAEVESLLNKYLAVLKNMGIE